MLTLIAMIVTEGVLLGYALSTHSPFRTRGFIAVNMILITLLASKLISLGGHVTNVGIIFYSAVMLAQAKIQKRHGEKSAFETVKMTLFALLVAAPLTYMTSLLPVVAGNEASSYAISLLGNFSMTVVLASFFAFMLGQSSLILAIRKTGNMWVGIFVGQLVDSAVFFPITFGLLGDWKMLVTIATTGFIAKVLITPIMYVCMKSYTYVFDKGL